MTWVRLDDGFSEHPKVIGVSVAARWAFVAGLCYCNRQLTDGVIPRGALRSLPAPPKVEAELVRAGLWEGRDDGSVSVHDYLIYNPSRAQVESERRTKAEAGRIGGLRSGEARRQAEPKQVLQAEPKQNPSTGGSTPVPDPVPVPSASYEASGGGRAKRSRTAPFLSEDERASILSEEKYVPLDDLEDRIDLALEHKAALNVTSGTWNRYVRNWLNGDLAKLPEPARNGYREPPYRPFGIDDIPGPKS